MKTSLPVDEVIKRYASGENANQIGKFFGMSGEAVRVVVRRYGKMRSRPEWSRIYQVDHSCFDGANPDSMYYAGLIMADGNIAKNGKMVQIELLERDIELLEGMKSFCGYEGPIQKRTRYASNGSRKLMALLRMTSPRMTESLARFGVIAVKAKRASIPGFVLDSQFAKFFLRGLFDGDGCFGIRGGKCSNGKRFASLGANPSVASVVKAWLSQNIGTTGGMCKRSKTFWVVHYGNSDATKVWNFLYSDLLGMRLARKANKYLPPPIPRG